MNQIMMSKEILMNQARKLDFKPENYEKVYKLLFVLEQFMTIPYLKDRLVLKGGTALNLFHFDTVPRLSVDIDLNYIGHTERVIMLEEKILIEGAIERILIQNQFEQQRAPTQHAGGKSIWKYDSALGQKGNIEIDLNYMFRKPLWPIIELKSKFYFSNSLKIPVLDLHEIAAGKLSALFGRRVSRDFFDAHYLLTKYNLNRIKLRETFVVYASCFNAPFENISIDNIKYDIMDIRNKLFPVLRQKEISRKKSDIEKWANQRLLELRESLSIILPFKKNELDFIQLIRNVGEVKPELITNDKSLSDAILVHPLVQWSALKAKNKK